MLTVNPPPAGWNGRPLRPNVGPQRPIGKARPQALEVSLSNSAGLVKVQQLALSGGTELKVAQVLSDLRQALLTRTPKDTELAAQGTQAKRTQIATNDAEFARQITTQSEREAFQHDWIQLQAEVGSVAKANMQLLRDNQAEAAQAMLAFSWSISRTLRNRVMMSQNVAERVRDGDFTVVVNDPMRDELSPLLQSLSDMQASLTHVVGTASAQIAQGNLDLCQRTEAQASSLEETAASMSAPAPGGDWAGPWPQRRAWPSEIMGLAHWASESTLGALTIMSAATLSPISSPHHRASHEHFHAPLAFLPRRWL